MDTYSMLCRVKNVNKYYCTKMLLSQLCTHGTHTADLLMLNNSVKELKFVYELR